MDPIEPDALTAMHAKLTEARLLVDTARALRAAAHGTPSCNLRLYGTAEEALEKLDSNVRSKATGSAVHRGFLAEADDLEAKARAIVTELSGAKAEPPADPVTVAVLAERKACADLVHSLMESAAASSTGEFRAAFARDPVAAIRART